MKSILFLLLAVGFSFNFAQSKYLINPRGELIKLKTNDAFSEILPVNTKSKNVKIEKNLFPSVTFNEDTLNWGVKPDVNFGFFGYEVLLQWFIAPADMKIEGVGFNIAAMDDSTTQLSVKLVKVNLTRDELMNAGVKNWGYYEADGNGRNNATAFFDNPDRTGGWVDLTGTGQTDIFGETIWPDSGKTVFVTPVNDGVYQWVNIDVDDLYIKKGEVIGVVLENTADLGEERVGVLASNSLGVPGFKYYVNGRLDPPNDVGWWSREYTWDFALAVRFYEGPLCPWIEDVTELQTTVSTEPREVRATITDCNPNGGESGITKALLYYSIDGNDFVQVEMDSVEENVYSGFIPEVDPCSEVRYYIWAESISGRTVESGVYQYHIFCSNNSNLLVFNGFTNPSGYPQSYYFGVELDEFKVLEWDHDVWSYGPLTEELVQNYQNIVEITTNGPDSINNDVIRTWLEQDGSRNYMLIGDEWLGRQSEWIDSLNHFPGEFHYDILGIETEYNDINYLAAGDEILPSIVQPVEGSLLGDPLFQIYNSRGDTMLYNPYFEIALSNWLDGVKYLPDVEVDMTGYGKKYDKWFPIGGHRTLDNGNKIVFLAFDPLSLDSPDDNYFWYGFTLEAPQVQALKWFGINLPVTVEENYQIPSEYKLYQNYPNPFNPTTIIKYSIPTSLLETQDFASPQNRIRVTLKVYDILGRKVATLVNEKQSPGNYSVKFDASKLSSGIYFYRLTIGDKFSDIKKMIFLK